MKMENNYPNDNKFNELDLKAMAGNQIDTDNDLDAFIEDLDEETLAGISYNIIGDFSVNLSPAGDQVSEKKRFAEVSYDDIDLFLATNENKNTSKKTKCDINTFKEFLQAKGEFRVPEIIPPFELNLHIASFLLSVKKKDGTEYEPTSLRAYMSSINQYLQQKEYGYSVINDLQFSKARDVLKMKQKQLKSLGKGNKPMAADDLTENEFRIFYEKKILGPHTPTSLTNSMFTICTNHFGMRPGREIHDLTWGDIQLKYDEGENLEYIVFNQERQTKTRTGANPRDIRKLKPRAYATPDEPEKDPVSLYKKYSDVRPEETKQENSPFFLAVNTRANLGDSTSYWYKRNAMGINKLYGLVKQMKSSAGIESDKRFTNHSMRKHLVQKLSDAGVPANQITQISGHKNINSINNYSKINNDQNRKISTILTSADKPTTLPTYSAPQTISQTFQNTPNQTISTCQSRIDSDIRSMLYGNSFSGQVIFNISYGHMADSDTSGKSTYHLDANDNPPSKKYKRILPLDSDSE